MQLIWSDWDLDFDRLVHRSKQAYIEIDRFAYPNKCAKLVYFHRKWFKKQKYTIYLNEDESKEVLYHIDHLNRLNDKADHDFVEAQLK